MSDEVNPESLALVDAVEFNLATYFRAMGAWSGVVVDETPNWLAVRSTVPSPHFNTVARVRLSTVEAERSLATFVAHGRATGTAVRCYHTALSSPVDLPRVLTAQGFTRDLVTPVMSAPRTEVVGHSVPSGVEVRSVETPEGFVAWVELMMAGFAQRGPAEQAYRDCYAEMARLPGRPVEHLTARVDKRPAGVIMLVRSGAAAGIYSLAVAPWARGRRVASALLVAAARAALGATQIVQFAVPGLVSMYERFGFTTGGSLERWTGSL